MFGAEQLNHAAWSDEHLGMFSGSEYGCLFKAPQRLSPKHVADFGYLVPEEESWKVLKSGPRKGERVRADGYMEKLREAMDAKGFVLFGDTAIRYITNKAIERVTGKLQRSDTSTRSMDRGTLLEPVAKYLLPFHWSLGPISDTAWQKYGTNSGATPDGLLPGQGNEPWDLKCPEDSAELVLFDDNVKDDDHEAMLDWNDMYYWQIMLQAKASGAKAANITFFTDKMPLRVIERQDREAVVAIINGMADHMAQTRISGFAPSYTFASNGFHFVNKRFTLTDAVSARIDRVLNAAEVELLRIAKKLKKS